MYKIIIKMDDESIIRFVCNKYYYEHGFLKFINGNEIRYIKMSNIDNMSVVIN